MPVTLSCRSYLAMFVGFGAAASVALALALPPPPAGESADFVDKLIPSLVAGFIVSGFLTAAVQALWHSAGRRRDLGDFSRTRTAAPEDGERTVASGRLDADGPLLRSPLTGRKCVAYRYEVRKPTRAAHELVREDDYAWGYALTPSHIDTPWGPVRLLSFTDMPDAGEWPDEKDVIASAQAYFAGRPMTPYGVDAKAQDAASLAAFYRVADGEVRGDFGGFRQEETRRRLFGEKVLVGGEAVTAVGYWDAQRRGLRGEPGNEFLNPVVVRKGRVEEIRTRLHKEVRGGRVAAAVFTALAAVVAAVFVKLAGVFVY